MAQGSTQPLTENLWADFLEDVGTSNSHYPMGLHGLLQGQLYFFPLVNLWRALKDVLDKI
jgi:hypothetical protein